MVARPQEILDHFPDPRPHSERFPLYETRSLQHLVPLAGLFEALVTWTYPGGILDLGDFSDRSEKWLQPYQGLI